AALAGESSDQEFVELGELALALRGERPQPRPEYVRDLDRRAAEGFPASPDTTEASSPAPTGPKLRLARVRIRRPNALSLAVGGAASVFLVTAAVISSGVLSGGEQRARSGEPAAAPSAPATGLAEGSRGQSAAPSQTSPSNRSVPSPGRDAGTAPD